VRRRNRKAWGIGPNNRRRMFLFTIHGGERGIHTNGNRGATEASDKGLRSKLDSKNELVASATVRKTENWNQAARGNFGKAMPRDGHNRRIGVP